DGYASCEDVDIALREGLALRWSFMGPFETIDLNAPQGVRDYIQRYSRLYDGLFETQRRRAEWRGPVSTEIERQRRSCLKQEDLAARHLWRDRRLIWHWPRISGPPRRTSADRRGSSRAEEKGELQCASRSWST